MYLLILLTISAKTGYPKIKVSIKNFNSDVQITLIHSLSVCLFLVFLLSFFIISSDSVNLYVLFNISFVILTSCLNEI